MPYQFVVSSDFSLFAQYHLLRAVRFIRMHTLAYILILAVANRMCVAYQIVLT